MKLILRVTAILTVVVMLPALLSAQAFELPGRDSSSPRVSPNGFVGQTIGSTDVHISYGRPFVKGRDIFGAMLPYGKVWRAGANEATAISIPENAKVGGEELPAGVYSFFAIPGESEWTLIFNSQAKIWGTQHDAENDVLRVTVEPREAPHREMLTYYFEEVTNSSATIVLSWAMTEVPFTLSFK
jgi:hypothetical protein